MYVGLRELRSAKWRFALITGVVFLLALLVTGLSALTAGLGHQGTSAVEALGSGRFAYSPGQGASPDLERSTLTDEQVRAVQAAAPGATGVGIARTTLRAGDGAPTSVVVLGLGGPVGELAMPAPGEAQVTPGAQRVLGGGDAALTAESGPLTARSTDVDLWFQHSPVVVTDLETWHRLAPRAGAATLVAGAVGDAPQGLTVTDEDGLLSALPAYQAEHSSLTMMSGLLLGVSALVAGAFFTVWGIQRRRDVAILKALGAATSVVVKDALGQAVVVLAIGVGAGALLAAGAGLLVGDAVPYLVSASTTVVPAVLLSVLGLLGAAAALRPVLSADPNTALGALR